MKIKTIAVSNLPDNKGRILFEESLKKHGIDYEIINVVWKGFLTKIQEAYNYAKNTDADYIIFTDAHDVVFVGGIEQVVNRMEELGWPDALFGTEKACWPESSLADQYTPSHTQWKYLNSGNYIIKPKLLVDLIDNTDEPIFEGMDDQLFWSKVYLENKGIIKLDIECKLFQTLGHDDGSSFGLFQGYFVNIETFSFPVIVHGNGTSAKTYDYSYINL